MVEPLLIDGIREPDNEFPLLQYEIGTRFREMRENSFNSRRIHCLIDTLWLYFTLII